MKEKTKPIWCIIKDFINSKPLNTIITRKELLDEIYKIYNPLTISEHTIDSYRNILTRRTEYLKQTEKRGMYIINKHIQSKMSSSDIRQLYNSLR